MNDIVTSRLRLRPMSVEFLEACLRKDTTAAERLIGLKIPNDWFEQGSFIKLRLGNCVEDPAYQPWSVRAIGLDATQEMTGYIGFHSRPNADYLKEFVLEGCEFGYTIFTPHRRRGYALEAAQGLMRWASAEHHVRNFVLSISPANLPSTAMAAKMGFQLIGEHMDEVDGLEHVFLLASDG